MAQYYHALRVDAERCRGHLTCMRECPTHAIRVRDNRAVISHELCVDCGICIQTCPAGAVLPVCDPLEMLQGFRHKILVPSAVLYSQFEPDIHPSVIREACRQIGFDDVVDVSTWSVTMSRVLLEYIKGYTGRLPLISSNCPAIIRLIQVNYPDLVEQIIPLDVPRELAAREIRTTYPAKMGLKPEEIGIVYAAPCPAKVASIKQPAEKERSWFDAAISIRDLYSALHPKVMALQARTDPPPVPEDFSFHTGWAALGGITRAVDMENWLAVSGLDHVMHIFDDIENSRLRNVDFVEALACMLGCIGGPFNVANPYVARTTSIKQRIKYETPVKLDDGAIVQRLSEGDYFMENPVRPRPTRYFDTDLVTSIKRMKERERVYQKLPQKDCGCCGAPTCMTFAEDFVRKEVELTDCIYIGRVPVQVEPKGVDDRPGSEGRI
jgi:iron only hydrogenase large subunit-like protein